MLKANEVFVSLRQFFLLIVSFLLLFLLNSCHQKERTIAENEIFRYNQIGGLESLDPAFAKNLAIMWQVHFIYNTLVEVDSQLQIQPSIAKSYAINDLGTEYTFYLRNDVYFQNHTAFPGGKGRKMTAHDVVYSFNRVIDPSTASPGAWVFNGRVATKKPFVAKDDTTLVIALQEPFAPFLEILSMPYCSIVPHEVVEKYGKDFRSHPCGTGPFQLVKWDENNTLILHRNEHYWEKDAKGQQLPYLKAVQTSFNETRAMEFLLLKDKQLDFVNGIDGSMKDVILTKKGELKEELRSQLNLKKGPYLNTEYLGILLDASLTKSPLLAEKLRYAINLAINRDVIVTYFRNGVGIPAVKGFTPSRMPGMEARSDIFAFNPERAVQLVNEVKAERNGDMPIITLNTPEANVDVCNLIVQQLENIGLKVKIEVLQPSILRQMMSQGQSDFFKAQWIADYPDAETYLAVFFSQLPAPPNYTRFKHEGFDALYLKAMKTSDIGKRQVLYRQMDSLISKQGPVIPLFYDEMLHFTTNNITGFTANPMNIIDIKRVKKM